MGHDFIFFFEKKLQTKLIKQKRGKMDKEKIQSTQEKKVKCGGGMHMCCNVQEGGAGLTLGCRKGGGHQGARSSCGQEERAITKQACAHTLEKQPHITDI